VKTMIIRKVRIGDVCAIKGGYAFKSTEFIKIGIPVVKITNIVDKSIVFDENSDYLPVMYIDKYADYKVEKGDVLIALSGATTGKYGMYNHDKSALLNQRVAKITADPNFLDTKYLFYYMSQLQDKVLYKASGVAQPNISADEISNFTIALPPIEIQKKIINMLDKAQELIDKRKAQIEALDQLRQSVFLEMFGDPYRNPKNWPIGTIKDITLKTQYGTSKKANENKGKYPILRMGNITYNGLIDFNDMKYVDLDDSEVEKYLVHKGDLLFNRTNSKELVGKTAVYREEKPVAYAGYLIKLIPNENANSEFISGYLNSKYGKALLYSMAKNIVGMANINAEELTRVKIYIPPRDLQDKFASIISNILKKRELLCKGLDLLEENFNSLMQRAFNGELFTEEKVSNPE